MQTAGHYEIKQMRNGRLIWCGEAYNAVVDAGLDYILSTTFEGVSTVGYFFQLIDDINFVQLDNTDTLASHPGWQFAIFFTPGVTTWVKEFQAPAGATSTAPAVFTAYATKTVRGISCFKAAPNELWSTALFSDGPQTILAGDTLEITYTVQFKRS